MPRDGAAASDSSRADTESEGLGGDFHRLIRQGKSFSGRERNCCFLNVGATQSGFVDVSSVSGFDFPDDGRSIARVDWDHDGDIDFWVANRNAPQVRFLRNEWDGNRSWLVLRLRGTTCNRDAIGARVEVVAGNAPHQKSIKTLYAGDGFLSQSSKWVHFGLGEVRKIERVEVSWPGGEVETFTGFSVNHRYRLVQGSGEAAECPVARGDTLEPGRLDVPARSDAANVFSVSRLPVPDLEFMTFGTREMKTLHPVTSEMNPRPILLNLWASWCAPCVAELKDFSSQRQRLQTAGVALVSMSTDALSDNSRRDDVAGWLARVDAAEKLLKRLQFPFSAGFATESTVDKLQLLHDELFDVHLPLPVPTSMLIDTEGNLAALYRGSVDLDRVLDDVANLQLGPEEARNRAVPFPGRWNAEPSRLNLFQLMSKLVDQGHLEDGLRIFKKYPEIVSTHHNFYKFLAFAGDKLWERTDGNGASWFYREALKQNPDFIEAKIQLAWILATDNDDQLRDGFEAVQLLENIDGFADNNMMGLAALAAAYAEVGRFDDAVQNARIAAEVAEKNGDGGNTKTILAQLELYEAGHPYRQKR